MTGLIQTHNQKSAAVWNSGGAHYEAISRGIADSIEHCVLRLDPKPGERVLDLARLDVSRPCEERREGYRRRYQREAC